ncbi:hypothetical protein ES705_49266 [subsurface metagenome]
MAKYKNRHNLTCSICGKRFLARAKKHPIGRLVKHRQKEHPVQYKKSQSRKGKTRKSKVTKLDKEFMAIDDILLADLISRKTDETKYNSVHEQLGGLIIEALLPIAVESIARAIKKKRTSK